MCAWFGLSRWFASVRAAARNVSVGAVRSKPRKMLRVTPCAAPLRSADHHLAHRVTQEVRGDEERGD